MRINCHTYGHWKSLLICAMSCPYTDRCKQYKAWRQEPGNQEALWQEVLKYIRMHPSHGYEAILTPHMSHNLKESPHMKRFVCVREDQMMLLTEEEIMEHLLQGQIFDEIFELGREMELQIRLVPSKGKKATEKPEKDFKASVVESEDVDTDDDESSNGVTLSTRGRRKKSSHSEAVA